MKKIFLLLAIFATIPASISCMNEDGNKGLIIARNILVGGAVVVGGYIVYNHLTTPNESESSLKNVTTTPSDNQSQEQPKLTPQTNVQQSLQQIEHQKAVDITNAFIQLHKEEQKKAALSKEKLQQTNAPQPEVITKPVSETSKPSVISVEKQSDRDHIGDIFAEHLTIIMG